MHLYSMVMQSLTSVFFCRIYIENCIFGIKVETENEYKNWRIVFTNGNQRETKAPHMGNHPSFMATQTIPRQML